jgi:hypothetical protein
LGPKLPPGQKSFNRNKKKSFPKSRQNPATNLDAAGLEPTFEAEGGRQARRVLIEIKKNLFKKGVKTGRSRSRRQLSESKAATASDLF